APPPRPGRRPGGATGRAVLGRAHHRSRSTQPGEHVGEHPGTGQRRHHAAPHHPVPGGGRPARRRHSRHRPWPGHRPGQCRPTQASDRRRAGRVGGRITGSPLARPRDPDDRGGRRDHGGRTDPDRHRSGFWRKRGLDRGTARSRRHPGDGPRRRTAPPDTGRRVPGSDRAQHRIEQQRLFCRGEANTGGDPMNALSWAVADGFVVAKRNLIKVKRVPEMIVWVLLSPIMFVLLFAYVFGGSIAVPGGVDYREFLIAGIFAQTVVFGATYTGASLAEDMQKGIIDRFRSLPMSRSAVLFGRTASDVFYNVMSIGIMALTGWLVGWQIRTSVWEAVAGFIVLLLFSYAFSWVMATVGLLVPNVEVINNASFMVIMPLTFISNAFVPAENLPTPLRIFAEWTPVSAVTQSARELFGNTNPL